MTIRVSLAAGAVVLAMASGAQATTITGSYTAVTATSGGGAPSINTSGTFLPSPFTETLTLGVTTAPQNFLVVAPTHGSGLVTGSVVVDFSLSDGSAVTGVTGTAGANPATLVGGMVQVNGNYGINYSLQTDCITWAGTCTPPAKAGPDSTALSETLAVSFADGAVLDLNLYSWVDWNMQPQISFELASAPNAVMEPASLALFVGAVGGLGLLRRRRAGA